jgi:hypothetical protein
MAKFYGKVGYAETLETEPGVWTKDITERVHSGDVLRISKRLQNGGINGNTNVNNEISIIADPYASSNFMNIRYVEWQGVKWSLTNVTVEHPRLILRLGGVYNGDTGPAT